MRSSLVVCLFASIFTYIAVSTPMNSMLGADGTEMSEGDEFINPYITDGLVAMWDGIENAGWGLHDDTITCPFELVSEQEDVAMTGKFVAGENCYVKPDNNAAGRSPILANAAANALNNGYCYIEVVSYINAAPGATYGNRFNLCSFTFGYQKASGTGGVNGFSSGWVWCRDVSLKDSGKAKICIDFDVNNSALTYRLGKMVANGEFSPPSSFGSNFYLLDEGSRLYSFRVYSRPLTEEERSYNEWIDKERFGL